MAPYRGIAMGGDEIAVHIRAEEIRRRVVALAAQISTDYGPGTELVLVGVLKGAFVFLADLARHLALPSRIDFVALASYGDETVSSGAVRLIMDLRTDIAARHVLIVEDIVDTGHTLAYLQRNLESRRPASLRSCALLRKRDRHEVEVSLDYVGFDIPDVWVVGYGLDRGERYRALPFIGILEPAQ